MLKWFGWKKQSGKLDWYEIWFDIGVISFLSIITYLLTGV